MRDITIILSPLVYALSGTSSHSHTTLYTVTQYYLLYIYTVVSVLCTLASYSIQHGHGGQTICKC